MKRRIIIFIDNIDILSRFFISDYVKRRQKSILTRIFSYKMKMILKKARQIVFYTLLSRKQRVTTDIITLLSFIALCQEWRIANVNSETILFN